VEEVSPDVQPSAPQPVNMCLSLVISPRSGKLQAVPVVQVMESTTSSLFINVISKLSAEHIGCHGCSPSVGLYPAAHVNSYVQVLFTTDKSQRVPCAGTTHGVQAVHTGFGVPSSAMIWFGMHDVAYVQTLFTTDISQAPLSTSPQAAQRVQHAW